MYESILTEVISGTTFLSNHTDSRASDRATWMQSSRLVYPWVHTNKYIFTWVKIKIYVGVLPEKKAVISGIFRVIG